LLLPETPFCVWNLLPPSGPVVLVPHPMSKAAAIRAVAAIKFRNIFTIMADAGVRAQIRGDNLLL
jgi:hypothetical protein